MNRRNVSASIAMMFVCAVCLVLAQPASAQVVFDNATGGGETFDHDIGGGSDRVLIVGVGFETAGDVSEVTYDGVAMTLIDGASVRVESGAEQWVGLFWLGEADLPGAGTYEVAIDAETEDADRVAGGAISLENASQDGPEATATDADFDSEGFTELDVDITTVSDGAIIVDIIGSGFDGDDGDQDQNPTGQTLQLTSEAGSNGITMSTLEATTAGVHNVGYELEGEEFNRIALAAAAIGPAGPSVNLSLDVEGATFTEEGGSITLSANDTMSAPFQWQLDGGDLGGETNGTLSLSPTTTGDSGVYTLDFEFDDGAKVPMTSNPVSVSIFPAGALPVAGIMGLGVLALLGAVGGTVAMRRRSR